MISEENVIRSIMSTTTKECVQDVSDEKNAKNERKIMNEDKCFKPKKGIPIKHFYKTYENKVEQKNNNNNLNALLDHVDVEEEDDDEINESKIIKEKFYKIKNKR